MIIFLYILGYLLTGVAVWVVWHNIIVSIKYPTVLKLMLDDRWETKYYGKGEGPEKAALNKIKSYGDASFPATLLAAFPPIGILALILYGIYRLIDIKVPGWLKPKPYRELYAKQKAENEAKKFKEALRIIEADAKKHGYKFPNIDIK